MREFETEVNGLQEFKDYLSDTTQRLNATVTKKMASMEKQDKLRQERHSLENKFLNQKASRQYNIDKIMKGRQSLARTMEYIDTLHDNIKKIE